MLVQFIHSKFSNREDGFTIIEVIVALALLGILVIMASGLLIPLSVTNQSNTEGRAAGIARSYIEILKSRWQIKGNYITAPYGVPTVGEVVGDIKIPTDWTLTVNSNTWKADDTIRTVTVTVTPDTKNSNPVVLEALITRPS